MKLFVFFTLVSVGCILASGCVGQIKNTSATVPDVTPPVTFTAFTNVTNVSDTSNTSDPHHTPGLNGSVRVSIGALDSTLPAYIDDTSIGNVSNLKPLDLMLEEGNHTIGVCCGIVCEKENVTIRFGKQQIVDFSEKLTKNCEFFEPTVRIAGYSQGGDVVQIHVEFINPTTQTLSMSAEVTVGYSYIDSRSKNREGNFVKGQVSAKLNPGDRTTKLLSLDIIKGSSYIFNIPVISGTSIN